MSGGLSFGTLRALATRFLRSWHRDDTREPWQQNSKPTSDCKLLTTSDAVSARPTHVGTR